MAQILNGKAIAADLRKQMAVDVAEMKSKLPNFSPGLAIVQVAKTWVKYLSVF